MILPFAFHVIILILTWPISPPQASAQEYYGQVILIAQPDCNSTCGDFKIPFPFGMNDPKCYADKWFEIECRSTSEGDQKPYLKSLNLQVTNVYWSDNTVEIMNPIHRSSNCQSKNSNETTFINLRGSPFVYSQGLNTFVAVGCNSFASLQSNGTTVGGCVSICDDDEQGSNFYLESESCSGRHCCQTSLPTHLSEYNATLQRLRSNTIRECSYALVIASYGYSSTYSRYNYLNDLGIQRLSDLKNIHYARAVLEWEILINDTRIPSDHANCTTTSQNTTAGRRCECFPGFYGNPYVTGGCTAISFRDFDKNNRVKKWAIVGVCSSLGSIALLICLWRLYKVVRKRVIKKRRENFFIKNGGLLLEQRMSSGEVNVDRTNILFSLKDLKKATDNFNTNRVLGKGGQGTVYKGMLVDGKIVAVKKFKVEGKVEEFINEFVILSQINNRNVVKLLGCCLETEIPLLVYEFIPNGNLYEYLHDQNVDLPVTWDMRLRIATEIAGALFYLHSIASQPIYHRDIKSSNILLDEKYRAKLADFGASRMISIEATHLTTVVQGTFGYLDPEYFHTSQFTDKSDVYSFGVVLAELLTSQRPISSLRPGESKNLAFYFVQCMEENTLFDIIDERVTEEGEKEHIIAVANLAYRCLELNGRKRPTMKEVTLELERIRGLNKKSNAQPNHEEIELAEIEEFQPWTGYSTSNSLPTLSIETLSSDSEVVHILATK